MAGGALLDVVELEVQQQLDGYAQLHSAWLHGCSLENSTKESTACPVLCITVAYILRVNTASGVCNMMPNPELLSAGRVGVPLCTERRQ